MGRLTISCNHSSLRRLRLFTSALLAIAALATIVSCGPQVIEGRPPFISISSMSLEGETLSAEFTLSNQNGVPMTVSRIDIKVTVNEVELTSYDSPLDLTIDANSAEDVVVDKRPDDFTRSLLNSLESGDLNSLPFDLEGRVLTAEDGYLSFEQTGYLYPVPGKPNQYRSAVTHARGLKHQELP